MLIDLAMYGIIQMGLIHWKSISILREKREHFYSLSAFKTITITLKFIIA